MSFLIDIIWFAIIYSSSYYITNKLCVDYSDLIKGIFNVDVRWRNIQLETSFKERHKIIHTFASSVVMILLVAIPLFNTFMYLILFRAVEITILQKMSLTLSLINILQDYRNAYEDYVQLIFTIAYYYDPSVAIYVIFTLVQKFFQYHIALNKLFIASNAVIVHPWIDDKIIACKNWLHRTSNIKHKLHIGSLITIVLLGFIFTNPQLTAPTILFYYYEAYIIYTNI